MLKRVSCGAQHCSSSYTQQIGFVVSLTSKCILLKWGVVMQAAAECVNADDLLMDVLAGMFNDHKSSMGVMHDGKLVGNISISDLRFFNPDMHASLLQPVGHYLLAMQGRPAPEVRHTCSALLCCIFCLNVMFLEEACVTAVSCVTVHLSTISCLSTIQPTDILRSNCISAVRPYEYTQHSQT
jgi:hypothetical protein